MTTKEGNVTMIEESAIATKTCGLRKSLQVIGGRWKILLLCSIQEKGTVRYGELKREVAGITNTMLAKSLQEMERDGMVIRHQYNEMPVRVEYSLSPKGASVVPILLELKEWGAEHL